MCYAVNPGRQIEEPWWNTGMEPELAAAMSRQAWLRLLIRLGCDPNCTSSEEESVVAFDDCSGDALDADRYPYGMTPLQVALSGYTVPCTDFLAHTYDGKFDDKTKIEVVQLLLEAKADANVSDAFGDTPLHSALLGNEPIGVVQALLEANANVTAEGSNGKTPLDLAQERDQPEVVDLLRSAALESDLARVSSEKVAQLFKECGLTAAEIKRFAMADIHTVADLKLLSKADLRGEDLKLSLGKTNRLMNIIHHGVNCMSDLSPWPGC